MKSKFLSTVLATTMLVSTISVPALAANDNTITRGQAMNIISSLDIRLEGANQIYTDVTLTDPNYDAIQEVTAIGLVGGYGSYKFGPNDPLSKEQLELIRSRLSGTAKQSVAKGNATKADVENMISALGSKKLEVEYKAAQSLQKLNAKVVATNEQKAMEVLNSLATGDSKAITNYVSKDGYIQHNLTFPEGRQTMLDALSALKAAGTTVEIQRVFEDGNYIFLQTKYALFGNPQVGFDIFRFENGTIVEHWDNLDAIAPANPSGHTQFDGTKDIKDLDRTESNKTLVSNFVRDVLRGENMGALTTYFDGDNYIQHNSGIADGLSGLGAALEALAKANIAMVYDKTYMILGQGNFVLAVSEGTFGGKPTSYYDLFRVENGKIAEHWDVMEIIAPEKDRANTNGKFTNMEVTTMTNKEKAIVLINSFASGDTKVAQEILTEGYIQHNLAYGTGRDAFVGAVEYLGSAPVKTTVKNVRAFEDGNYVFLQTVYNFAGAGEQVAYDVFRFENGKIAEHWDNLANLAKPNPSGHTQIDGATFASDLDKTEANKTLVSNFVRDVLRGENMGALTTYFNGDNYIQHNTDIADGLSGLGSALEALAKANIAMVYNKTHLVVGQGDFVLAISEGTFGGTQTSYYDLFRVENGKIAEHWDIMETITPEKDRANTNGKF